MLNLLYLFLLIAGCFRYQDGCKRLRRAQMEDTRYSRIPDADVVEWWHRVSRLDQEFGVFFKRYGLFLIFISLFNLILNIINNIEIPLNGFTIIYSFTILILIIIGFLTIGDNDSRLYPSGIWPLDFHLQKDDMLEKYKWQNFSPYTNWTDKNFFNNEYTFYAKSVMKGVSHLLSGSKRVKWGAIIYYGSWSILILTLTTYHIFIILNA